VIRGEISREGVECELWVVGDTVDHLKPSCAVIRPVVESQYRFRVDGLVCWVIEKEDKLCVGTAVVCKVRANIYHPT
jgi:hypothetical protein